MTADDIAIHESFSKLFKKIALVIHPDKMNKNLPDDEIEMRINMFTDAKQSLQDKKYFVLLEIAENLKISLPKNYDLQTRWMSREFEKFYRKFCAEKNVNIAELDRQHKERLDKLYGRNEIADNSAEKEPEIDSIGS